MSPDFWRGKRVLITGHTGFKGSWMSIWLSHLGANVKGLALEAPTSPSLFKEARVGELIDSTIGDIRDLSIVANVVESFNPDIVFHMAAQPLVRYSYQEPLETYTTNVIGTVNLFEAIRKFGSVRVVVNVTTDKCYENKEWVWGYRENEPMGGHDPYSSSKACSELVTAAYRNSFFHNAGIALASARAGNVIGGGDWATDRLVPDLLRSFGKGEAATIRNPNAIRPWQHVLEPLSGYMALAEKLWADPRKYSDGWNFGPADDDAKPVGWIADNMSKQWGSSASWKCDGGEHPHEAHYLKLDISKARQQLGWSPRWKLEDALGKVIEWHRSWLNEIDVRDTCLDQIHTYSATPHHS